LAADFSFFLPLVNTFTGNNDMQKLSTEHLWPGLSSSADLTLALGLGLGSWAL